MKDRAWILIFTLVLESVTLFCRFGLDLQSTRDTTVIGQFTFGYRIHHGYIGLLVVIVMTLFPKQSAIRIWGTRLGWALVASDLIHHFAVLWPVTGSPQFDIRYH